MITLCDVIIFMPTIISSSPNKHVFYEAASSNNENITSLAVELPVYAHELSIEKSIRRFGVPALLQAQRIGKLCRSIGNPAVL